MNEWRFSKFCDGVVVTVIRLNMQLMLFSDDADLMSRSIEKSTFARTIVLFDSFLWIVSSMSISVSNVI